MKTNIYTDEESLHKDSQIGSHLENIIERIANTVSGTSLDFYKREFDFFNKVTAISGTIRSGLSPLQMLYKIIVIVRSM